MSDTPCTILAFTRLAPRALPKLFSEVVSPQRIHQIAFLGKSPTTSH